MTNILRLLHIASLSTIPVMNSVPKKDSPGLPIHYCRTHKQKVSATSKVRLGAK